MGAYLITGPSGAGKTTVGNELKSRGFEVVDMDVVPGLCAWVDIETGKRETSDTLPPLPWSDEWMAQHAYRWDENTLRRTLGSFEAEDVFFCGGAYNETAFVSDFNVVFGLQATRTVLRQRLLDREPERYAGNSGELEVQLDYNDEFHKRCRAYDYTVIDSTQPVQQVAMSILWHLPGQGVRA